MPYVSELVDCTSCATFAVDRTGRILTWNAMAETLLGYTADEAKGQACSDVLQGVHRSGEPLCTAMCEGRSCFENGTPFAVTACRVRHKDGRMLPVSIASMVIPADKREPGDAVAVIFLHETDPGIADRLVSVPLRIFTLGHFSLVVSGRGLAVDSWKRRQALVVLKYLVAHVGRPVHRERLIDVIWPGETTNRGWDRLKVAVSFLRGQLRQNGVTDDPIKTVDQCYLLRPEAVWIDAIAFEKLVSDARLLERRQRPLDALLCYEDAQRLYRGDYLEDDPYADWCAEIRARLAERKAQMIAGLAHCHAQLAGLARSSARAAGRPRTPVAGDFDASI